VHETPGAKVLKPTSVSSERCKREGAPGVRRMRCSGRTDCGVAASGSSWRLRGPACMRMCCSAWRACAHSTHPDTPHMYNTVG